jgi:hypothetical protein
VEFLQPLALLGLAGAAVPALLHLLQRREPPTVDFPAVRYLAEAERRHSQRLRFRNLLLLLVRTLLIVALALAAARPVMRAPLGEAHAPSAVVMVFDNSLSSGAMVDGRPRLDDLRDQARAVADRAAPGDRLWLVAADGVPRSLAPGELADLVGRLAAEPVRLDLGAAVRAAARLLATQDLPGAVVVLSDLQTTAFSPGDPPSVSVVVLEPGPPPPNRGVDSVRVEPESWSPAGQVVVTLGGAVAGPGEVALDVDGRTLARGLGGPGEVVALRVERLAPGWHAARLTLAPDELRADDEHSVALRAAPPAAVALDRAGPFVEAAIAALTAGGRVQPGRRVVIGEVAHSGSTIVLPPADPARVAAVNRALAARGVPVRLAALREGEWRPASPLADLTGATVRRRYALEGDAAVVATAGGDSWLMRAGNVVVAGSRFEEEWTDLPLRPAFVPFLDALVNRVGAGEAWRVPAAPGSAVRLPGSAAVLLLPGGAVPVAAGGSLAAPAAPGVYFVAAADGDTVGALVVNPDPRESDLRVASPELVSAAFGTGAGLADPDALVRRAFAARRAELTTLLLALVLVLAVVEFALAGLGSGSRRGRA